MTDFNGKPLAIFASATAAMMLAVATPAAADIQFNDISIGGVEFDDDEDLLTQLIELDADDIDELREEFAEAREDIADAVLDIEEGARRCKRRGLAAALF